MYDIPYMWNPYRLREQTWFLGLGNNGEGIVREFGIDMYTLLYLNCIISKDLLNNTGNSAHCYLAVWMGGEFGRMDTCTCMTESLFYSLEIITTLLTGCTAMQNRKKIKNKI